MVHTCQWCIRVAAWLLLPQLNMDDDGFTIVLLRGGGSWEQVEYGVVGACLQGAVAAICRPGRAGERCPITSYLEAPVREDVIRYNIGIVKPRSEEPVRDVILA